MIWNCFISELGNKKVVSWYFNIENKGTLLKFTSDDPSIWLDGVVYNPVSECLEIII